MLYTELDAANSYHSTNILNNYHWNSYYVPLLYSSTPCSSTLSNTSNRCITPFWGRKLSSLLQEFDSRSQDENEEARKKHVYHSLIFTRWQSLLHKLVYCNCGSDCSAFFPICTMVNNGYALFLCGHPCVSVSSYSACTFHDCVEKC